MKVEQLVIESGWLAEAVETDGLHLKNFIFYYSDRKTNAKLLSCLRENIRDLPPNSDYWKSIIESIFADAESKNSQDLKQLGIVSGFILTSCIKCDVICKTAKEFPKDKKLQEYTFTALSTLGVSLSILFPGIKNDYFGFEPIKTAKFGDVEAPSDIAMELMDIFPNISNSTKEYSPFHSIAKSDHTDAVLNLKLDNNPTVNKSPKTHAQAMALHHQTKHQSKINNQPKLNTSSPENLAQSGMTRTYYIICLVIFFQISLLFHASGNIGLIILASFIYFVLSWRRSKNAQRGGFFAYAMLIYWLFPPVALGMIYLMCVPSAPPLKTNISIGKHEMENIPTGLPPKN